MKLPFTRKNRRRVITTEEVEAEIRAADAELDRDVRRQRADLELAEVRDQIQQRTAQRRVGLDLRTKQAKKAIKRRTKCAKRRARRTWWDGAKARFIAALGGRLVAVLVAMAAGTAWYGQFRYLHGPAEQGGLALLLPFAVAGATALEVLGLAMGTVVRAAGVHRDRALRARLLMWAVIAFSAWSNWTHNGVVLAVLSVAGPTAWEIHEWWQRRARLHARGVLRARPVRPRFPLDQWLLFFCHTLAAYRVAVRDRIEDADTALSVAATEREVAKNRRATERQAAKSGRWLGRRRNSKKWGPAVQTMLAANRAAEAERADRVLREAQSVLDAAALVWGPEALREATEPQQLPAAPTTDATDRPRRWWRFGRRSQTTGPRPTSQNTTTDDRDDRVEVATEPTGRVAQATATDAADRATDRPRRPSQGATDRGDRGDRRGPVRVATETTGTPATEATEATDRGDRVGALRVVTEPTGTTEVDVSDLLEPARQVAAELGDRLSRDALLNGLRARGLSVGGRRRTAIYDAVKAERAA